MIQLQRTLKLSSVVIFGLAYMTPIIVLGTFGILADATHGVVAGAYAMALVAMVLTAWSYGLMAAEFPTNGSAYVYVRKSINPHFGFMIGWAVLLDYLFLPMVIWLFGAVYLNSAFPSVPMWMWIIGFIGITTAINILGIKVANKVNYMMMLIQILILIAFIGLSIHYIVGDPTKSLFDLKPFYQPQVQLSLVAAGAAIACYSFLGFDAVTTLSEETVDAKKNIPRAILLVAILGGGIFIVAAYLVQLAHPGFSFVSADTGANEIAKNIGGDLFVSIFLIGLIIGQFASGLAAQASGSRLLFAMARDGVLPKSLFGKLHPRYFTPVNSILLCGATALLAIFMDVTTSVSFINFGAFLAFTSVNLSVIARFYTGRKGHSLKGIMGYLLIPALGAIADIWLLINLDSKAITLGILWLGIGFIYLLFLTRGLKSTPPEVVFVDA